jgi:crotonobetainyl-CoA:carnitine CoA-transferase CaiB-like acyl-CoA transferase
MIDLLSSAQSIRGGNMAEAGRGPLAGLRVLEVAQFAAGPFPALLLADFGADVVKVEPPGGDGFRTWPPQVDQGDGTPYSMCFAVLNRNKRSVVLDLKNEADRGRFLSLCAKADVLVENNRPGAMDRLGLGFEHVKRVQPRIVYCSVSGYGYRGPYSGRGAFDVAVQAVSGYMSVTGEEDGGPAKCGVPVGDFMSGVYGAFGIMVALEDVRRSGQAKHVDCAMLSCMLASASLQLGEYWGTGRPPGRIGSRHARNAPYRAFEASDKFFVIAAGNDGLWHKVCDVVELPRLKTDSRFQTVKSRAEHDNAITEILQPIFRRRRAAEWLAAFESAGVPCAPVYDFAEVCEDPQVRESGILCTVKLPGGRQAPSVGNPLGLTGYRFEVARHPPALGQHQEEVFREWLG